MDTFTFSTFASDPHPLRLLDASVGHTGTVDFSARLELRGESTKTDARLYASAPALPEPGKLGLIGVGLFCIAVLVRRRRRP